VARKTAKSPETKSSGAKTTTATKTKKAVATDGAKKPASKRKTAEPAPGGNALVIVESPKKARSINKFLGGGYVVKASMGHVRDLPKRKLGLDVEHGYKPSYEIVPSKKDTVNELKREAARADLVYLATDPDREGEAIAWHLQKALGLADARVRRVLFHEITERAVKEAFQHTTPINMDRVNAQQARRFLDRFVGYQLSPLLWKKVARNLSAGRVQSVAVRLIAEREREIRAFVPEEYWKITARLSPETSTSEADIFEAELAEWQGEKFSAKAEPEAAAIVQALDPARFQVSKVTQEEKLDKADPPFKTSTLQQQAAIRLRFSGKRTMKVAQELYEGIDLGADGPVGLITYMRTDSLRVSQESIDSVRALITQEYGPPYLPEKPNRFAAGKLAQEAHEAIRPTDLSLTPDKLKGRLSIDQLKLYTLIYRRFVASQMTPAVFSVTNVEITAALGLFKVQGKVLKFDGHRRVLPPAGKAEDRLLPVLEVGQALKKHEIRPSQHFTQPPPRYSEATLIKALEKEDIGRPSTYAPIIQTIQDRMYVEQKERRFYATELGMVVTDLLVKHFPKIMDFKFTAHMEDELDDIATAKEDMVKVLDEFYHPFQEALQTAESRMERVQIPSSEVCQECGAPMVIKFGRTGPFLSCSKYPECKGTRQMNGQPRAAAVETEHRCPKCGKPLLRRDSKRGPFLACSGYPACKEAFNIDPEGNPVPSAIETDHTCPKCGKIMAQRQGPRGPFLGCTGYPKCRFTMPVDEQGNPVAPVEVDVLCPKCGAAMAVKRGRRGAFLGCTNYPKCRGTAQVPEELKEKLGTGDEAAKSAAADLKAIPVDETCENCGGEMKVRKGRKGYFLGCSNYPKCRGTKEPSEATMEKILAVVGA
jgi:DNA topoisomerase-1